MNPLYLLKVYLSAHTRKEVKDNIDVFLSYICFLYVDMNLHVYQPSGRTNMNNVNMMTSKSHANAESWT